MTSNNKSNRGLLVRMCTAPTVIMGWLTEKQNLTQLEMENNNRKVMNNNGVSGISANPPDVASSMEIQVLMPSSSEIFIRTLTDNKWIILTLETKLL